MFNLNRKALGKVAVFLVSSAIVTKLLINSNVTFLTEALNTHFNDFLINILPAPKPSNALVTVGVQHSEALDYFKTQNYRNLEKILDQVMAHKPMFAITTFRTPYQNIPKATLEQFVDFTKKYPNLYFYASDDSTEPTSRTRNSILKNLNLLFIPLCVDGTNVGGGDRRARRLLIRFTLNGEPYQTLFPLLRKYGIERDARNFQTFPFLDSKQTFLRYRGPNAYLATNLTKYLNDPGLGKGKILVFGPAEAADDAPEDRAFSVYPGLFVTSMQQIALALDTLILKDPVVRTLKPARSLIGFAVIAFYVFGLIYLSPIWASAWGFVSLLLWFVLNLVAFAFFSHFLFLVEVAIGIGAIHFLATPTQLIRYFRKQDRLAAEREKEAELARLRSKLVVRSARADLGMKIATQVAHDIRSPLSAMTIALQKRGAQGDSESDKLLKSSIERMRQIADDLLKRFISGDFYDESSLSPVDLKELLESLVEAYRQSWPNLRLWITGETATVMLKSRTDVERAFSNLINNAVEAASTQRETEIKIHIEVNDVSYIIHFLDNGPGIPADIRPKIFERGATFGKTKGSGLGLAQVRDAMVAIGGDIELVPSATGAHFKLNFPKPQAERQAIAIHRKLILVEDSASVLQHWAARFRALGAEVSAFSSPEDFHNTPLTPDTTVITDLIFQNSEQTGFDILERCHSGGCQAILCSSLGDNHEIQMMARGLAERVMTKNQIDLMAVTIKKIDIASRQP